MCLSKHKHVHKLAETEERNNGRDTHTSESQPFPLLFVMIVACVVVAFLLLLFLRLLLLFVVVKSGPYVMRNLTKIFQELKIAAPPCLSISSKIRRHTATVSTASTSKCNSYTSDQTASTLFNTPNCRATLSRRVPSPPALSCPRSLMNK